MTIKEIIANNHGLSKPYDRFHNGPTGGYSYPSYHAPPSYHTPDLPPVYHGPPAPQTIYHPAPPPVFKHYSFSHSGSKSSGGGSAALSALTLLAFLFFLNILQQCLKDQMQAMNPPVMVMASGREEISRTEKPPLNDEEKTYTLIDASARNLPKNKDEKRYTKVKIVKLDNRELGRTETIFVNAMSDENLKNP